MNREGMIIALEALNTELSILGVRAEIGLYGGAVMCLVLNARQSTHDIDAIFEPRVEVRESVRKVAYKLGMKEDWFNDAVKGFVSNNNDMFLFSRLSNMDVYVASAPYMFAMKAVSCRLDNDNELNDIRYLIDYLGIQSAEQALDIISYYYPANRILPKTQYMLLELLGGIV